MSKWTLARSDLTSGDEVILAAGGATLTSLLKSFIPGSNLMFC